MWQTHAGKSSGSALCSFPTTDHATVCHWPRPPTNRLPGSVLWCWCACLCMWSAQLPPNHSATHTYTYIYTQTHRHDSAGWVCASLKLHLTFAAPTCTNSQTHTQRNTHIFGCIFISKLVISDHFCNFHLSLDCFPFECHSWLGHVLHHASDMKSCFRLTFLYMYLVSSHIYICTYMHTYTYMYTRPSKTKAIFRYLNFSRLLS